MLARIDLMIASLVLLWYECNEITIYIIITKGKWREGGGGVGGEGLLFWSQFNEYYSSLGRVLVQQFLSLVGLCNDSIKIVCVCVCACACACVCLCLRVIVYISIDILSLCLCNFLEPIKDKKNFPNISNIQGQTLGMVGVDTSTRFTQEWIFN